MLRGAERYRSGPGAAASAKNNTDSTCAYRPDVATIYLCIMNSGSHVLASSSRSGSLANTFAAAPCISSSLRQ